MGRTYYTLIGSLPALPKHFADDVAPLPQLQFEERWRMLDPRDERQLQQLADFIVWDRQPPDRTDDDVVRRYGELMSELSDPLLIEMVSWRMELRTIVCGLRRRRLGFEPPIGVGSVARHVARNWKHPHFRLESHYPWVVDVARLLDGDAPLELERRLMEIRWQHVTQLSNRYSTQPFSFASLVLYLVRREIVLRWQRRDEQAGRQKFQQLLGDAMGKYARLFEPQT